MPDKEKTKEEHKEEPKDKEETQKEEPNKDIQPPEFPTRKYSDEEEHEKL